MLTERREEPPFFHGVAVSSWGRSRRYRVYTPPRELVFIYAGSGNDIGSAVGVQFGAIGGLIAGALIARKKKREQERLDRARFDELITSHEHNFRVAAGAVSEMSIEPRSFWFGVWHNRPLNTGFLRFNHPEKGRINFCIESQDDLKIAVKNVPESLRNQVVVNVEWDAKKKKFVRKA